MNLAELCAIDHAELPVESYLRGKMHSMPALDPREVRCDLAAGHARKTRGMVVNGDASLFLTYKNTIAAAASIAEHGKSEWQVLQVQGAKSRVSYRVATGMRWREYFARRIAALAAHPEAEVERLTMPHLGDIVNIDGARNPEGVSESYAEVRNTLGMKYDGALKLYVVPVRRQLKELITGGIAEA